MTEKVKLGDVLIQAGLIDEFQLRSALAEQKRWGGRLGQNLIKLGFADETELLRVLSRHLGVPVVRMQGKKIEEDVLKLIPTEVAEKYSCVPLFVKPERNSQVLYVGMDDPTNLEILDDLSFRIGMKLRPILVGPTELQQTMDRYYRGMNYGEIKTVDLEEIPLEEKVSPSDAKAAAPREDVAKEPSSRMILRALTQLLIEKKVIERQELIDLLREIQETELPKK